MKFSIMILNMSGSMTKINIFTNLLESLNWLSTGLAIFGAYLVSNFNRNGFVIWCFTNSFFLCYNFLNNNMPGVVLFFVYLLISINGLREK
jgi:hypothetical protein